MTGRTAGARWGLSTLLLTPRSQHSFPLPEDPNAPESWTSAPGCKALLSPDDFSPRCQTGGFSLGFKLPCKNSSGTCPEHSVEGGEGALSLKGQMSSAAATGCSPGVWWRLLSTGRHYHSNCISSGNSFKTTSCCFPPKQSRGEARAPRSRIKGRALEEGGHMDLCTGLETCVCVCVCVLLIIHF